MIDIYGSTIGLLAALHTIQDVCKSHPDCFTCPLCNAELDNGLASTCGVRDAQPHCWNINDDMDWRALK